MYAAAQLKEPLAVRSYQQMVEQGEYLSLSNGTHKFDDLMTGYRADPQLTLLRAMQPAASKMPLEDGMADFAWADEMSSSVVVKVGPTKTYLSLNWRRKQKDVSNVARVHSSFALRTVQKSRELPVR